MDLRPTEATGSARRRRAALALLLAAGLGALAFVLLDAYEPDPGNRDAWPRISGAPKARAAHVPSRPR